MSEEQTQFAGRIEGGIDAIVIGADADGLAAAAYLGKAGMKTVLLESGVEIGGAVAARTFESGLTYMDGEHLVSILDPVMIDDLDLYRHGLGYAARRLETVYFFESGETLQLGGDMQHAGHALDDDDGGPAFQQFAEHVLEAAAFLRPLFEPQDGAKSLEKALAAAPSSIASRLNRFVLASAADILDAYLPDEPIKTAMLSEAAFRSAAAPDEAFSFMTLARRWAGEASGLQAALAYPAGGAAAVIDALRRAAQSYKVDIRSAAHVSEILIEHDRAAGVTLDGGGQIRAPMIIASASARRVFMEMIGPAHIDIEFQRAVSPPPPALATAQLHLALKGVARDDKTREKMRRRLVYAPPRDAVRRAFAAARAGETPDDLIIEGIFPAALEDKTDTDSQQVLSVMAHPLPFELAPDDKRRADIEDAILANIEKFAPELADRVLEKALRLPPDLAAAAHTAPEMYGARNSIIQQFALSRAASSAGHINGLYFCGPEAQIGAGLSCIAGRAAARKALRELRRGGLAA